MTGPAATNRVIDPRYLAYQYGDSEKLRIRLEAHERYSEHVQTDWYPRYVALLGLRPSEMVLDVGCGFGAFHPALTDVGARIVAFDFSAGMAREAWQRADHDRLPVNVVRADAQHIPLADRAVDGALASHMLYHVPDIRRALEEMRRVVKVGGRVLITTNAADHSQRLEDLHTQAVHELGLTPAANPGHSRFSLDDLPLVRAVFPNTVLHRHPNAFLFPTVDAALRYYASGRIDAVQERQEDGAHRPALLERMGASIGAIIEQEGVFRVPKGAGAFLATVES